MTSRDLDTAARFQMKNAEIESRGWHDTEIEHRYSGAQQSLHERLAQPHAGGAHVTPHTERRFAAPDQLRSKRSADPRGKVSGQIGFVKPTDIVLTEYVRVHEYSPSGFRHRVSTAW
ncbi:MAG: hypothetical protein BWY06_03447 [Candidatus Latescibacteria bacterium ADurb.Bin168]|nr:MAG: hypothetical protein BWY06_03447 [Candidatus Latescibacteria bacterium ADurb.Bin168]